MNAKNLAIRVDRNDGSMWLTEERPRQPIKRIGNITDKIFLALAADLSMEENTKSSTREIKFSDGTSILITVEQLDK